MTVPPAEVPLPAHPTDRREPLPWEHPKSRLEEVSVAERLRAIMEHPSYQLAEQDHALLQDDALRGFRLHLDYLKAERGLAAQGIEGCVVVFGSTRVHEPATARLQLEQARSDLAATPDDSKAQRAVQRGEWAVRMSRYYQIGRELGRLVAQGGHGPSDPRLVVMTGGGPGCMEAANRGSFEAGARTVGLNIVLPREQYPNPYITPGLCFQFHYFAMRKLHFMKRASALVALPGGFGTMDELFGALTLIQTRKVPPLPIILVGEQYWRRVFDVDFLVEVGSIDEEDRELFWFAETAQEVWDGIRQWHSMAGTALPCEAAPSPNS